ncbi:MAG: DUF2147 domain-containing protein [Chitinophagales bacterium]
MKNLFFIALMPLLHSLNTFEPDDIQGTWLTTGNNSAKVTIYRRDGKYYGKIAWLKVPTDNGMPKLDKHNPNPIHRKATLVGLTIINGFKWDASDQEWEGGTIYDPASGNSYSGNMQLQDINTLKVRGYIGISLIGRTEIWSRVP